MATATRSWRTTLTRRALFQVHLWLGIAAGLYISLVSVTGAALVFRIDLQRAVHSSLLLPRAPGINVEIPEVLRQLEAFYPRSRIYGVDAPTTSRPVYLAYVSDPASFRTVLIDPSDGRVLGELPDDSPIRTLQELHFSLLGGEVGRRINGIGAICLLLLACTGAMIWWQRDAGRWGLRELHAKVGIWSVLVLALWAMTALSFTFPKAFRATINAVLPLSKSVTPPQSDPYQVREGEMHPSWESIIERSSWLLPGHYIARVVLPSSPTDAVQVLLTSSRPTPADTRKFETLYVDQYTGSLLEANGATELGAGDKVLEWVGPLHVGSFGGPGVKILWTILGLAPPLLFCTAFITWWRRVGGRWHEEMERVGGRRGTDARHLGAGAYAPQERDAR